MTKKNLTLLRQHLNENDLSGFIVPRADAWPGEFISERAERLTWLSGFSGSAGIGIVLNDKAAVLTDGRYTLQVKSQTDADHWQTGDSTKTTFKEWLIANASSGAKIGFDPFLHSYAEIETAQKELHEHSISLIPAAINPIDDLWKDQPAAPRDSITLFPMTFAGQDSAEKIEKVCEVLKKNKVDQFFFTFPDSIAWLLNIRGNDVVNTPVPLSYGILTKEGRFNWFIDVERVPRDVQKALPDDVKITDPKDLDKILRNLEGVCGIDTKHSAHHFVELLPKWQDMKDPSIQMKACKNEAEQKAIKQAHIRDGRALTHFHRWLIDQKNGSLDEKKVEQKLQALRLEQGGFVMPSFDTIAGYGANGAVIHYRSSKATNQKLGQGGLLLMDSGAQYLDQDCAGTTDVTRTYIIGTPSYEQKYHYTMVLRAHIAIANAKFPYGTRGAQIDAIGRSILWQEGLDFAHGLGHGVGCFLNVHEEAAHLSPRGQDALEAGMLLSNEPGLYFEGQYGIRIENLMFVQKTGEQDILGRDIMCFETITLAPYDNDLIDFTILNGAEMSWLQNYYTKIEEKLGL